MNSSFLKEKILPIIELLKANDLEGAEKLFSALDIVDTLEHLALPEDIRQLIWALYEYLVVSNYNFTTREELIDSFSKIVALEIENKIYSTKRYINIFYVVFLLDIGNFLVGFILNVNYAAITTVSWPFLFLLLGYLCKVAELILGILGIIKGIRNFNFTKKLPDEYALKKRELKKLSVHLIVLTIAVFIFRLTV